MLVQVSTDRHIAAHAGLVEEIQQTVTSALSRFSPQVTRVGVHLADENGEKEIGDDKRCVMEARVGGLKPYAVSFQAPSVTQAVNGTLDRLIEMLERQLGKVSEKKGRASFGHVPG